MFAAACYLCLAWIGTLQSLNLTVSVIDENATPVVAAKITLTPENSTSSNPLKGETDFAGKRQFESVAQGIYTIRVEKPGFYAAVMTGIRISERGNAEEVSVTLNHEQELRDSVNVIYSPPAIDASQTAASNALNARELVNIPYPTSRDYRNALPFIPGVLPDWTGQVHINGAATHQIIDQFDGFNISNPATGLLELRVSPDGLRSIDVTTSRYSAAYGKGSGGVISLNSQMGDDRFRFSATDFIPSFQVRKGVNINGWTPRATVSGPIKKGRAWFFDAWDGEYNLDIIDELERGEDSSHAWRLNNLAKFQYNVNQTDLLSGSFVINQFHSYHAGLGPFFPKETTRRLEQAAYLVTLRNQKYYSSGKLLDLGFAFSQFDALEVPLGNNPFVITPATRRGNFFRSSDGVAKRLQWVGSLNLSPIELHGRHEIRFGGGLDLVYYTLDSRRHQVRVSRADGTLARTISFDNNPSLSSLSNFELSSFVEDRWSVSDRTLVELGLRLDWDQILRRPLFAPRFAATHMLKPGGDTKLSIGGGLFFDATNLNMLVKPSWGKRYDQFYGSDGTTPSKTLLETSFVVNERDLTAPRFSIWSAGIQHKLPGAVYLDLEYTGRYGTRGLAYLTPQYQQEATGILELQNGRSDRYDGLEVTLKKTFGDAYTFVGSYTRSRARSNVAFEAAFDDPVFSGAAGGPLPWDAPNRLLSWGWAPLPFKFELSYTVDWRTGYPFCLVDSEQKLVGAANSARFPDYFSINLHLERRFKILNYEWALRAGFNNLTDHLNASAVDNNIDSPTFMRYGAIQGRTFTGRIRFLGRK